jgi:hypothetical protein
MKISLGSLLVSGILIRMRICEINQDGEEKEIIFFLFYQNTGRMLVDSVDGL